ncbi:peptidylprolyl isomerase [Psychromarinibacter sp. C21-152]|uniref:Parvulin-like PPIase n=1 Tax=Psychromarinibacter sediminicola TaxID=3033385 RepID=A0AAE3NRW4_9RHOB|nr:peptidylprolyl isomerase [Psychromarinibacter sediminicola]MDF0600886.1 peptidylprolyl isomerase [Psychromarinibacter sediminicola]
MPISRLVSAILCAALALIALPAAWPAQAQGNLFAPVVKVNDRVVTQYEVNQRARFYEVLNAPGDPVEQAMKTLVNERLQLDAAERLGVEATEEEIEAGLDEFAARANLSGEEFVARIGEAGVAPETIRDFVRAGVLWRGVVRAKFGPRAQVTESEIDRAIALASQTGEETGPSGVRVLLSEIFLPTNSPENEARAQQIAPQIARIDTIEEFAAAARRYSAAPSREQGGRQGWIDLNNLPSEIRGQVVGLAPGDVVGPIQVPNALAFFQLRALEETGAPAENAVAIEFARFFIPGGRTEKALAEARRIEAEVDTCDDLYGIAKGLPEERLMRDTLPVDQIAGDIAIELAKLDQGEVSTALTTADAQTLVFLMLCGRTMALEAEIDRDQIRQQLINQRLASYASGYLAELRADAYIEYP